MRFGINTFLFVSPFTTKNVNLFKTFKSWGSETIEIPIEDPSHIDPVKVKAALDKEGLVCGSACGCFGPDRDLRGTAEQQKNSMKYLKALIDQMVVLDCPTLAGPIYSAVGRAEPVPAKEYRQQWKTVVKNIKEICKYAEDRNKQICVEPLNRYETDFINTIDQLLELISDVGSPALKVHYDTYHMNIEEKFQPQAIEKAGKLLGHIHACGCDRGTPGNDHIDWKGIAKALKKIKYNGDVVIESFTQDVKVIAKAASIWRKMEPNRQDIAIKGLKFLKKALK